MATASDLVKLSMASGVCALSLSAWHSGLRTLLPERLWFLINWLDRVGIIGPRPPAELIVRNAGIFGLDAKFAMFFIGYCSVCFACLAMYFAYRADQKRAATLYPAIASVLGALALTLFNIYLGFLSFVLVAAAIVHSRSTRPF